MEQQLEGVRDWLLAGEQADYQAGVLLLQQHSKNRGLVAHLLRKESAGNREKLSYELVKIGCLGNMDHVSEVMNHFAQAVQGAACVVKQVADVLTGEPFAAQPEPEQVPEAVRSQVEALTELMTRLYNQRCQLSNRLHDLDPAEGPRVVGEILSLQQQYNALAQKRRNLVEGGQPAEKAALPNNLVAALAEGDFSILPADQAASLLGITPDEAPAFNQAVGKAAEAVANEPAPPVGELSAPALDRAALLQQRGNLRSRISKSRKAATEAKTEAKRSEHEQKVGRLEVELQIVETQLAQPQP
ncbi:MAG: hypothetical protein ACRYFK_16735 [Janthinobacterium lividum]